MRTQPTHRIAIAIVLVALGSLPAPSPAQEKTRFSSLRDALRAAGALAGGSGPRNVNWIEGGKRFSFTIAAESGDEEIRAHDPVTGRDTLLFTARGTTFPAAGEPFEYESFQWAEDSRHLVFQTRFQPLYRRSGVADYYVYRLADGALTLAARGARTAALSPNGAVLGYERDGDLFVYDVAGGRETRLT
ncbi:MAG: DPP IV N-terminal domain-containing protein, partial [Gemmatimonadetes bacterium]|nr:DPP IV N-terminal domain-containing protein [Gemmatimonadota bacterium]